MTNPDDLLDVAGVPNAELLDDIKSMIINAESSRPRTLQRAIGPSEAGHECERHLAFKIVASMRTNLSQEELGLNRYSDPLAAIIGTSVHSWLEEAAREANRKLGRIRWVPEAKVQVTPKLKGTCDLYDIDTQTTLDWKVPGSTRHKHYVKYGPSNVYRGQAHLYGKGYRNLGLPVSHVGIVFINKTGTLRDIHLWREPYNEALVEEILARLDRVDKRIEELELMTKPENFLQVPITPGDHCSYCSWHSPMPEGSPYLCGGKDEDR